MNLESGPAVSKGQSIDVYTGAKWIVYTLGSGSETQKYLSHMIQALESYYHPANFGAHSGKLIDFLSKLVTTFVRRLHR